jgi:hypothetical protein
MSTQNQRSLASSFGAGRSGVRIAVALIALAFIVWWEPISVPANMDFGPFYRSISRIFEGQSMYYVDPGLLTDSASRDELEGQFAFPGPPWYPIMFLPLGLLSPERAALTWALINIALLYGTMTLVVSRSSRMLLMSVFAAALLSAPIQGHLIIGQFTILAGFGFALALWAFEHQLPFLTSVGLMLAICRPHLGLPLALMFVVKGVFTSRVNASALIRYGIVVFAGVVTIALLIQPTCLRAYVDYVRALSSFRVYQVCDTCSSFPMALSRVWSVLGENVWGGRLLISAMSLVSLGAPLFFKWVDQRLFVSGGIFLTLFALPSIRNYDYVLLAPGLALVGTVASREGATWRRSCALGMILFSGLLAGVVPYMLDRELQGRYLWLTPLAGYLAIAVLLLGRNSANESNSEPKAESCHQGCALPDGAN